MALKLCIAAAAAMGIATASPAADCWNRDMVAAARISEFNAAMTVTTMRCSLINVDIRPNYDAFTIQYKKRLRGADEKLKKHFGNDGGKGENAYRSFYTQIGNRYGASQTDSARCALFAAVATELARAGNSDEVLDKYALALVPNPTFNGERCPEIAAKP